MIDPADVRLLAKGLLQVRTGFKYVRSNKDLHEKLDMLAPVAERVLSELDRQAESETTQRIPRVER